MLGHICDGCSVSEVNCSLGDDHWRCLFDVCAPTRLSSFAVHHARIVNIICIYYRSNYFFLLWLDSMYYMFALVWKTWGIIKQLSKIIAEARWQAKKRMKTRWDKMRLTDIPQASLHLWQRWSQIWKCFRRATKPKRLESLSTRLAAHRNADWKWDIWHCCVWMEKTRGVKQGAGLI